MYEQFRQYIRNILFMTDSKLVVYFITQTLINLLEIQMAGNNYFIVIIKFYLALILFRS